MANGDVFLKTNELPWQDVGGGLKRQILGYDAELMLVRVKFKKGSIGKPHGHPHRQVSLIESGAFEVHVAGKKTVLTAGDGFYVPPEAVHGAVALQDSVIVDVFSPAREDFVDDV